MIGPPHYPGEHPNTDLKLEKNMEITNKYIYITIYIYDFHGINTNKNQNLICPGMVDTPVCGRSIPIFKQTYASGKDGGGLAGQKSARMMTQKFLLGTQHHSKTHSRHHLSPKKGAHQHEF